MIVKKAFFLISIIFVFLFLIYLLLPSPTTIPPLPDSVKSTESGDTVQIPGVSAYFSQQKRDFVTKYYQDNFDKVSFLGLKLPSYRLNHPPELSHEKIRDNLLSSYFEEVVHPFRESLFINGWEPDVFFKGNKSAISRYVMIVDDQNYFSKTTLRPFYSNPILRVINFFGILASVFILYFLIKRIVFQKHED